MPGGDDEASDVIDFPGMSENEAGIDGGYIDSILNEMAADNLLFDDSNNPVP